jgi:hypothetical protein
MSFEGLAFAFTFSASLTDSFVMLLSGNLSVMALW